MAKLDLNIIVLGIYLHLMSILHICDCATLLDVNSIFAQVLYDNSLYGIYGKTILLT